MTHHPEIHDHSAPSCLVPPSPDLLRRLLNTRAQIFGGEPDTEIDVLDTRTMALVLGRRRRSKSFNAAAAAQRAPVSGTRRALVLLVDFSSQAAATPQSHYSDMLFSTGTYPTGSMHDFYREASYGQLSVDGEVSGNAGPTAGWYRAPQPKSFYTHGEFGTGTYPNNSQKLVEDLVTLAGPFVDFSNYDNDGDGIVDALVVLAAGTGAEVTGSADDIWSHAWGVNTPILLDGVRVSGYFIAPEDGKVGVMSHELGHSLMGWPDLYDTDYSSSGTGAWDLMAGGSWNGGGDRPAHPSAWCKSQVGWVTPTVVSGSVPATLRPYSQQPDVYKLPVHGISTTEYFLVSNRNTSGFDADLPGAGLIIEHIDDTQTGNTDESHYLVDIEQCDGRRDLNLNANRGDGTDAWPAGGQASFTASSTPNSLSYDGTDSSAAVTSIAASGADITAVLRVGPDQGVNSMSSIVGTWDLTVDWGNDGGGVFASQLVFNANGSWTYPYGGGRWVQVDGLVMWNFSNAAGLIYSGTVTHPSVNGAMGYATSSSSPGSGSFYLIRSPLGSSPRKSSGAGKGRDLVISGDGRSVDADAQGQDDLAISRR